MIFSQENTKNIKFKEYYNLERPYILSSNIYNVKADEDTFFVPTVLVDLIQIVDNIISPTDSQLTIKHRQPTEEEQIRIHNKAKDLVKKEINFEMSDWDVEISKQLEKLENFIEIKGKNASPKEILACKQLVPAEDLIRQAASAETLAHEENQYLFWRFSSVGHTQDQERNEKLSFGDSLLSGYIRDGLFNADIVEGLDNYGACVFSYYLIHQQAVDIKEKGSIDIDNGGGKIESKPIHTFPPKYQKYINSLNMHELYALKCPLDLLNELQTKDQIDIPNFTVSSSACYLSGEDFHPRISLFEIPLSGETNNEDGASFITLEM